MPHDDRSTLLDMLNAARNVEQFIRDSTIEQFSENLEKQSAVLHQLILIGEAAKRLSDEFRFEHAIIPWSEISRMRDRLIHMYHDVDLKIVWDTSVDDVPVLRQFLERAIERPPQSSE